jgi:hypothetical protein
MLLEIPWQIMVILLGLSALVCIPVDRWKEECVVGGCRYDVFPAYIFRGTLETPVLGEVCVAWMRR